MTLEQQQAWETLAAYLSDENTADNEAVRFAIEVKDRSQNRADGGDSLAATFENNDIVFPVVPLTSVRGFCRRKAPTT